MKRLDLTLTRTYSVRERHNLVTIENMARPGVDDARIGPVRKWMSWWSELLKPGKLIGRLYSLWVRML